MMIMENYVQNDTQSQRNLNMKMQITPTVLPPGVMPGRTWSCLYCGLKFDSKLSLKNHGIEVHPLENIYYKSPICTDCGSPFQMFKHFAYHIQTTGHMKHKYKAALNLSEQAISSSNLTIMTNNNNLMRSVNMNLLLPPPPTLPMMPVPAAMNMNNGIGGGFNGMMMMMVPTAAAYNGFGYYPIMPPQQPLFIPFTVYFGVPYRAAGTAATTTMTSSSLSDRAFQNPVYAYWVSDNRNPPSTCMIKSSAEWYFYYEFPSTMLLELKALTSGLKYCISLKIDVIKLCGTSELLQKFLKGEKPKYFKTVYLSVKEQLEIVMSLLKQFVFYDMELINVEDNIIINQLEVKHDSSSSDHDMMV